MPNAIIYCRVSTNKQEKNWDSLENQERACRSYCKNNSINVIWVFKEAFTWKDQNRPILNKSILNAIENKVDYYIVFDIDRLSREWYSVYSDVKNHLQANWITLKDSKNIIWDSNLVVTNDKVDMSKYKWNRENRSEMAEMVYSAQAKIEWDKIIQRTIPREIELEQQWYQVRWPNYWYTNKKIKTLNWKASIQIKNWTEWDWVIYIFESRAEWLLSDKEIVEQVNLKWCIKKRNNKPMDVKYMQELIKNPIYAWVIKSEWTWKNPIKTAYDWLVSIDIWNKANKGKIQIIEIDNTNLSMLYKNDKSKIEDTIEIKEKRKDYNSEYPYSKVLMCPECKWTLTWNNAKSRSGTIHNYYQCTWKKWIKHKNYSLKQKEVNDSIMSIFTSININNDLLKLFEDISEEVYIDRKDELINNKELYSERIKWLKKLKEAKLQKLDNVINFPILLESLNNELEDIQNQIIDLEYKFNNIKEDININTFKSYSINLIKHIDKIVQQKEKPDMISLAFDIMFNERIVFEKLDYQTINNKGLLWLQSQQKNPSEDEFPLNLIWQPH